MGVGAPGCAAPDGALSKPLRSRRRSRHCSRSFLVVPTPILVAALGGLSDVGGGTSILTGRRLVSHWFHYLLAYGTGFPLALALSELVPSGL
jgi:hypothetical protein